LSATRWLRFAVGGLDLMVAAAAFRRALPAPAPLPERIAVGDERYPVVDPRTLAGGAAGSTPAQLLLVLADGDLRLALPAAELSGTFAFDAAELAPLPWPYPQGLGWCSGVLVPAEAPVRPILALDLAGLLRAAEKVGATAAEVAR
jgi:hypothetical protein